MGEKHVVLVGAGHAHIQVLDAFAESSPDCRLTLVVDTPMAVYSGMVPGFVAGQYRTKELQIDPVPLAERAGAEVVLTRAVGIDPQARRIELENREPISYDIASFDIGSTVAGLDLPGVREHALPTRPIGLFVDRVDDVLDAARKRDGGLFRVVLVGAGAGGVELAFTLPHRLRRDTSADVQVTLLDNGPHILRGYADAVVRRATRRAAEAGIAIRCDCKVVEVEAGAVHLEGGDTVPFDVLVWVTGAVSHPVFRPSGISVDRRGFARIRPTLQFEEHDNLFGTGDCATLIDHPDTAKAGVYAVRQGPFITHNIRAALSGEPLRTYTPQTDFLALLNLGDGTALGTKWGRVIEGRWVMKLKDWIDRRFMARFPRP
jgi:selenide,water dikinase